MEYKDMLKTPHLLLIFIHKLQYFIEKLNQLTKY